MSYLVRIFAFMVWIGGMVLANGFWSTLFAIVIPPWSWYLVIERLLQNIGWIS